VSGSAPQTQRLRRFTGSDRRRRFGRYETLFRIAGGGMAEVYAARIMGEGGFEKLVALKRMLPTLAEDERFVQMFLDEGRVAANISSPNVVQTLDLGRADDDSLYLVMELVVGVPMSKLLKEVLKKGQHLDIEVATEILAQAAQGLHDAHQSTTPMGEPLRLIHRDISPQNILVDRAGRTRITDFGVARAMQRHSHTQTGEVKGKMAYFAPEQATGAELDHRVDVFALGIVAWECYSGRRLFKSDNPLHTLQKITVDEIPTIESVRPAIPKRINEVVMKALQRDPEERWETARDFATALRSAIDERVPQGKVGSYVREHGGESLHQIERGMKMALSGELGALEEDEDDAPTIMERTPLSTSAVVPSLSTADSFRPTPSWAKPLGVALLLLLAGGLGAGVALTASSEDPPEVASESAPAAESPPEDETSEVVEAAGPTDPPPEVEPPPPDEPPSVEDADEDVEPEAQETRRRRPNRGRMRPRTRDREPRAEGSSGAADMPPRTDTTRMDTPTRMDREEETMEPARAGGSGLLFRDLGLMMN